MLVLAACLGGCGKKGQEAAKPEEMPSGREDARMVRTAADTAAIRTLTLDYLNKLYNKDFEGAVDMLATYKTDSISTLGRLTPEERQKMLAIVQMFPVTGYSIDEINIFSEDDTEVRYTIELFQREAGDDRPNTMQFQLNPRRFNGEWYLCVDSQFRNPDKIRREDVRSVDN